MIENKKGFVLIRDEEPILLFGLYVAIYKDRDKIKEIQKLDDNTEIRECYLITI